MKISLFAVLASVVTTVAAENFEAKFESGLK